MTVVCIYWLQLYKLNNNAEKWQYKKKKTKWHRLLLQIYVRPILNWMQYWVRYDIGCDGHYNEYCFLGCHTSEDSSYAFY
jgi:hypothetical protein